MKKTKTKIVSKVSSGQLPVTATDSKPKDLIQFVRSKGNRVPLLDSTGNPMKDARNKVIMVREKGQPIGVVVARLVNGKIHVGWSVTNVNAGDKFDKDFGIKSAIERLQEPPACKAVEPMNEIYGRALNYFKEEPKFSKTHLFDGHFGTTVTTHPDGHVERREQREQPEYVTRDLSYVLDLIASGKNRPTPKKVVKAKSIVAKKPSRKYLEQVS
jgi:hypothetical protein